MNVVCVICSDLLIPSDDVFHTPCGHIFHFACVTQWLERSKTCPQCREKTTLSKIHRIYFNFSNNDTISEDKCSLQDKVDKLNFQLMLKEKDIKHYTEKNAILENQNKKLRDEVRKVEKEISETKNAFYALKEKINYLRDQNLEVQNTKKEIEQLQKKIETYKNVQTLIEGTTEDVNEMISRIYDPNTLIVYVTAMKKEMMASLNRSKEIRSKLRSLQQDHTKITMERNFLSEEHTKRKKLEKELAICESEKIYLQNKLQDIEKSMSTKKSIKFNSETANSSNNNSNSTCKEDKIENVASSINNKKGDTDKQEENPSANAKDETNSPYLPLKSGGMLVMNQYVTQKSSLANFSTSIFIKKPRIEKTSTRNERAEANTIVYDGFGGHSKFERFPVSSGMKLKKGKVDVNKPKKPKLM